MSIPQLKSLQNYTVLKILGTNDFLASQQNGQLLLLALGNQEDNFCCKQINDFDVSTEPLDQIDVSQQTIPNDGLVFAIGQIKIEGATYLAFPIKDKHQWLGNMKLMSSFSEGQRVELLHQLIVKIAQPLLATSPKVNVSNYLKLPNLWLFHGHLVLYCKSRQVAPLPTARPHSNRKLVPEATTIFRAAANLLWSAFYADASPYTQEASSLFRTLLSKIIQSEIDRQQFDLILASKENRRKFMSEAMKKVLTANKPRINFRVPKILGPLSKEQKSLYPQSLKHKRPQTRLNHIMRLETIKKTLSIDRSLSNSHSPPKLISSRRYSLSIEANQRNIKNNLTRTIEIGRSQPRRKLSLIRPSATISFEQPRNHKNSISFQKAEAAFRKFHDQDINLSPEKISNEDVKDKLLQQISHLKALRQPYHIGVSRVLFQRNSAQKESLETASKIISIKANNFFSQGSKMESTDKGHENRKDLMKHFYNSQNDHYAKTIDPKAIQSKLKSFSQPIILNNAPQETITRKYNKYQKPSTQTERCIPQMSQLPPKLVEISAKHNKSQSTAAKTEADAILENQEKNKVLGQQIIEEKVEEVGNNNKEMKDEVTIPLIKFESSQIGQLQAVISKDKHQSKLSVQQGEIARLKMQPELPLSNNQNSLHKLVPNPALVELSDITEAPTFERRKKDDQPKPATKLNNVASFDSNKPSKGNSQTRRSPSIEKPKKTATEDVKKTTHTDQTEHEKTQKTKAIFDSSGYDDDELQCIDLGSAKPAAAQANQKSNKQAQPTNQKTTEIKKDLPIQSKDNLTTLSDHQTLLKPSDSSLIKNIEVSNLSDPNESKKESSVAEKAPITNQKGLRTKSQASHSSSVKGDSASETSSRALKTVKGIIDEYLFIINKMGEAVAKTSKISAKLEKIEWFTGIYFLYKRFYHERKKILMWLEKGMPLLCRREGELEDHPQWEAWLQSEEKAQLLAKVVADNNNISTSLIKMNKKIMVKKLTGKVLYNANLTLENTEEDSKIAVEFVVDEFDQVEEKEMLDDPEVLAHLSDVVNALYGLAEIDKKLQSRHPVPKMFASRKPQVLKIMVDDIFELYNAEEKQV